MTGFVVGIFRFSRTHPCLIDGIVGIFYCLKLFARFVVGVGDARLAYPVAVCPCIYDPLGGFACVVEGILVFGNTFPVIGFCIPCPRHIHCFSACFIKDRLCLGCTFPSIGSIVPYPVGSHYHSAGSIISLFVLADTFLVTIGPLPFDGGCCSACGIVGIFGKGGEATLLIIAEYAVDRTGGSSCRLLARSYRFHRLALLHRRQRVGKRQDISPYRINCNRYTIFISGDGICCQFKEIMLLIGIIKNLRPDCYTQQQDEKDNWKLFHFILFLRIFYGCKGTAYFANVQKLTE